MIVEPRVLRDERGFFLESWNAATFAAVGIGPAFTHENHSRSARGVLRGVHFQNPGPQGKLVRVVSGAVWTVAVDLRRASPWFGRWTGVDLDAETMRMLWVPPGFGHGFLSLAPDSDVLYKCTAPHDPANEHALAWNDPSVGIVWPLDGIAPTLSARDRAALPLAAIAAYA